MPNTSGVAIYNSRLAEQLVKFCYLDCFVEDEWRGADTGPAPRYPISALGDARRPEHYDEVIFSLGNSGAHMQTFDALKRFGGTAWLHDANLAALHRLAMDRIPEPLRRAEAINALRSTYGPEVRIPNDPVDHDVLAADGLFMSGVAVRVAHRVLVSSNLSATHVMLDAGTERTPRPEVLPLAFPVAPVGFHRGARSRPVLVSLGNLHEIKRPLILAEALAEIPIERRPMLAFVGQDFQRDQMALPDLVASLGLEDDVVILGWTTEAEYWQWIADADLVVQLRERSNGESSAAVNEAMSVGRAVITSVAACAEMPPGVHVQVSEQIGPEELGVLIDDLLTDHERRGEIERKSREYAASWTFDHLARHLASGAIGEGKPW
jgi:glycosyltransferase involved in cell wall biosynthesis